MEVRALRSDLVNWMDSVLEEEMTERREINMWLHLSAAS
jgi:hypothetical protein